MEHRFWNCFRPWRRSNGRDTEDTDSRSARLEFLTERYRQSLDDVVNARSSSPMRASQFWSKDIELYSMCELISCRLSDVRTCLYPEGKVIGLYKVARLVDVFARRLQSQENLTCRSPMP